MDLVFLELRVRFPPPAFDLRYPQGSFRVLDEKHHFAILGDVLSPGPSEPSEIQKSPSARTAISLFAAPLRRRACLTGFGGAEFVELCHLPRRPQLDSFASLKSNGAGSARTSSKYPHSFMYGYAQVCYIGSMNKIMERRTAPLRHGSVLLTPAQRAAILRRGFGAWKGSVKESLRALSAIRRGWDRKIT